MPSTNRCRCRVVGCRHCAVCVCVALTFLQLVQILLLVVRGDSFEEFYVVGRVEALQLLLAGRVGSVHFHALVHAVCEEQRVCHTKTVRLHGVASAIVVGAEVAYSTRHGTGHICSEGWWGERESSRKN